MWARKLVVRAMKSEASRQEVNDSQDTKDVDNSLYSLAGKERAGKIDGGGLSGQHERKCEG